MKVLIDPGHGGKDPGAVFENLQEKEIVLDISKKLKSMLFVNNYKVAMTRYDDTFLSLQERVDLSAKEKPDIFVSIHCNSFTNETANGTETLYFPSSAKGNSLALSIQKELAKGIYTRDRGVKGRSNLFVLRRTAMPAVLVEVAFLSNSKDRHKLKDNNYRLLAAKSIFKGIENYFKEGK